MQDCVAAVEKGARWLDGAVPGWHSLINVLSLDINTWHSCILGQLARKSYKFVPFCPGNGSLGESDRDRLVSHGFVPPVHGDKLTGNQYTAAWRRLIEQRLTSTDRQHSD